MNNIENVRGGQYAIATDTDGLWWVFDRFGAYPNETRDNTNEACFGPFSTPEEALENC
jgi:hypothetical protein